MSLDISKKLRYYFDKLLAVLKVRQTVGGLEVSDLALRFAYFDGETWRISGVRLEPGILDGGKINNREKFVESLQSLKSQALGESGSRKKINVVASLSSINIYSQVFSLPIIEGENLSKAIELNIQMVSPMDSSQAYSGWQTLGEDRQSLRLEILSAFIDRGVVDGMERAFREAGFLMVAIESRALALARLLREQGIGFDRTKSYVLINLDNSGLDFLIIRRGQLYFEYFSPWRDVAGSSGEIALPAFEAAITRNLHQVMNFYGQHWQDPFEGVILSASALKEDAERIIKSNFSIAVQDFKLKTIRSAGPEWYVVLGCGLRGLVPRGEDKEMSLLGIGAQEEWRREQLIAFAEFWRLLAPVLLGMLFVIMIAGDLFLIQTKKSTESQSLFALQNEQAKENETLQAQAKEFNRSVALIGAVEHENFPKAALLEKVLGLAAANGVTLSRFSLTSIASPIQISGLAASEDKIAALKNAISSNPEFKDVNLPLAAIKSGPGGSTFSMTFAVKRGG